MALADDLAILLYIYQVTTQYIQNLILKLLTRKFQIL